MPEKIDFSKIRFLVVEANPLAAELMVDILAMVGAISIRKATDSDAAMRMMRDADVDIVITEWNLGGKSSGIDLVDFIRHSAQSPNRFLPVIMCTANSEQEDVVEARDKGVTEFLAKPFSVDGLYKRLVSIIARPRSFINSDTYFGPDRRRRQVPISFPDRRQKD
ncbi:MAG: hypothetical protein CMM50_13255 [Rhodospirillaceae bacterium]|nr:hypothetical protein [Rhodospirillaceae bacterium]